VNASVSPALDAEALAKELGNDGAPIACLCSSDAVYAEHAVSAARALVAAGARRIWLAGRPGEQAEELRAAGVGDYVYVGCDALAVLQAAFEENTDENGARR
jgi:methylmalonyl-CoA mutase